MRIQFDLKTNGVLNQMKIKDEYVEAFKSCSVQEQLDYIKDYIMDCITIENVNFIEEEE